MTNLYIPDRSLPRAFICDIDGTLSDHGGLRGHFEYSKVSSDRPLWPVIHIVEALSESGMWKPVFVTGRMDENDVRKDTTDWIEAYVAVHSPFILHMRKEGDYRKDCVVKEEIFHSHIAPRFWVEFALDDRNQVVQMWRQMGLPCLQVADGNF